MSEMETFIGIVSKCTRELPDDEDDLLDLEEKLKVCFARVDDMIYEVSSIGELDSCGFEVALPPQENTVVICHWYNGGASLREVVESLLSKMKTKEGIVIL